jgi:hypothetical protein
MRDQTIQEVAIMTMKIKKTKLYVTMIKTFLDMQLSTFLNTLKTRLTFFKQEKVSDNFTKINGC